MSKIDTKLSLAQIVQLISHSGSTASSFCTFPTTVTRTKTHSPFFLSIRNDNSNKLNAKCNLWTHKSKTAYCFKMGHRIVRRNFATTRCNVCHSKTSIWPIFPPLLWQKHCQSICRTSLWNFTYLLLHSYIFK
jgi:hypothetical protein